MSHVHEFRRGDRITAQRLAELTSLADKLNTRNSTGEDDHDSSSGSTRHIPVKFAYVELGPAWEKGLGPVVTPKEPLDYYHCHDSRLIYYFEYEGEYRIKDPPRDRSETVWYIDQCKRKPPYCPGEWVWCIFNQLSGNWEIIEFREKELMVRALDCILPGEGGSAQPQVWNGSTECWEDASGGPVTVIDPMRWLLAVEDDCFKVEEAGCTTTGHIDCSRKYMPSFPFGMTQIVVIEEPLKCGECARVQIVRKTNAPSSEHCGIVGTGCLINACNMSYRTLACDGHEYAILHLIPQDCCKPSDYGFEECIAFLMPYPRAMFARGALTKKLCGEEEAEITGHTPIDVCDQWQADRTTIPPVTKAKNPLELHACVDTPVLMLWCDQCSPAGYGDSSCEWIIINVKDEPDPQYMLDLRCVDTTYGADCGVERKIKTNLRYGHFCECDDDPIEWLPTELEFEDFTVVVAAEPASSDTIDLLSGAGCDPGGDCTLVFNKTTVTPKDYTLKTKVLCILCGKDEDGPDIELKNILTDPTPGTDIEIEGTEVDVLVDLDSTSGTSKDVMTDGGCDPGGDCELVFNTTSLTSETLKLTKKKLCIFCGVGDAVESDGPELASIGNAGTPVTIEGTEVDVITAVSSDPDASTADLFSGVACGTGCSLDFATTTVTGATLKLTKQKLCIFCGVGTAAESDGPSISQLGTAGETKSLTGTEVDVLVDLDSDTGSSGTDFMTDGDCGTGCELVFNTKTIAPETLKLKKKTLCIFCGVGSEAESDGPVFASIGGDGTAVTITGEEIDVLVDITEGDATGTVDLLSDGGCGQGYGSECSLVFPTTTILERPLILAKKTLCIFCGAADASPSDGPTVASVGDAGQNVVIDGTEVEVVTAISSEAGSGSVDLFSGVACGTGCSLDFSTTGITDGTLKLTKKTLCIFCGSGGDGTVSDGPTIAQIGTAGDTKTITGTEVEIVTNVTSEPGSSAVNVFSDVACGTGCSLDFSTTGFTDQVLVLEKRTVCIFCDTGSPSNSSGPTLASIGTAGTAVSLEGTEVDILSDIDFTVDCENYSGGLSVTGKTKRVCIFCGVTDGDDVEIQLPFEAVDVVVNADFDCDCPALDIATKTIYALCPDSSESWTNIATCECVDCEDEEYYY